MSAIILLMMVHRGFDKFLDQMDRVKNSSGSESDITVLESYQP